LAHLKEDAEGNANLMPGIIEAVKAYATIGEICSVFEKTFGQYEGK